MEFLKEWEDNTVSKGTVRSFEMIYPMKINILDQADHFRKQLPDRYNSEDNIYQYFQNIGGDLILYALTGMISINSRFLVVGKIPDTNVWPVFACALDKISASGARIGLVTFFTNYAEKMIKKQTFARTHFLQTGTNNIEGYDKPTQQVIISEPYASETQYYGIWEKGNLMEAFCRLNVGYKMMGLYTDREKQYFGDQNGYSAKGFIKKAWPAIINAIISKTITVGSQFRIKSGTQNPYYCLLRYDGVNIKGRTLYFTAISLTNNGKINLHAPVIAHIDKGPNFVSSKEIEDRRKEQIQQIDSNILDKDSNFEQGKDFKMSQDYVDDRYELKKVVESRLIKKLESIIAESINLFLQSKI